MQFAVYMQQFMVNKVSHHQFWAAGIPRPEYPIISFFFNSCGINALLSSIQVWLSVLGDSKSVELYGGEFFATLCHHHDIH